MLIHTYVIDIVIRVSLGNNIMHFILTLLPAREDLRTVYTRLTIIVINL